MKHYILSKVATYLNNFCCIYSITRIANNTIKIEFENKKIFYFDMTKSNSFIYLKETQSFDKFNKKNFNAPFDVMLQKKFNNSKIKQVYLKNNDKILNIEVYNRSSYKQQLLILQFEFTGKNTNVIILDENEIVLEALRHISKSHSSRVIKVGLKLEPISKPNFVFEKREIDDIETYLLNIFKQKENKELKKQKKQKIMQLDKIILRLKKSLNELEDVKLLEQKATMLNLKALKIVANLYKFDGFEKKEQLKISNKLFKNSKKAKAKANNQHIEETNLSNKLFFYKRLKKIILNCNTSEEIEFYLPKKDKNKTKTKKANQYKSFFIDEYKIMLGRNEKENIALLKDAKASDFWFHLQGQTSSHLILSNRKKTIPQHIVKECAKICAKFSKNYGGTFKVDYTQRRNVKIQSKANVLYNPYETIIITI
jgi:predicted ribosome quality control (RQC) complex YloA/Tae2 family protein